MSFSSAITVAALDTVVGLLAPFFLVGSRGDLIVARHAASRMLADYQAETEEELRLAAGIISFGFQALQALSEAAAPDLSLNRILRLRGGAVSLNRSAQQNQRTLDRLRCERRKAAASAEQAPAVTPDAAPALPIVLAGSGLVASLQSHSEVQPHPAAIVAENANSPPPGSAQVRPADPASDRKKAGHFWSQAAKKQRMAQRMAENHRRRQAEQGVQPNAIPVLDRMPAADTMATADTMSAADGAQPAIGS